MRQAARTGAFFFLQGQFPDLLILCGHRPLEPRGKTIGEATLMLPRNNYRPPDFEVE